MVYCMTLHVAIALPPLIVRILYAYSTHELFCCQCICGLVYREAMERMLKILLQLQKKAIITAAHSVQSV